MPILKQMLRSISLGTAIDALSLSAHATSYVFDAGEPDVNQDFVGLGNYTLDFEPPIAGYQAWAASFQISGSTSISSIEAYLGMEATEANVTYALFSGSGTSGTELKSGMVNVGASPDCAAASGSRRRWPLETVAPEQLQRCKVVVSSGIAPSTVRKR